jgi:hypothetical protein
MPSEIFGYTPENWKDFLTALAILVGGAWTFYQFALRKAFESALLIELGTESVATVSSERLVTVDVTLENKGNRRITLPPALTPEQINDYEESVKYPGDVQIKRVEPSVGPAFIGWWSSTRMKMVAGIPDHVSLTVGPLEHCAHHRGPAVHPLEDGFPLDVPTEHTIHFPHGRPFAVGG